MLISAQLVQSNDATFVNVYVYAHERDDWPADPADAFTYPLSLQESYEEIAAGGNLILGVVDVACPNETQPPEIYERFRQYAANLPALDAHPPFIWPLPPFALRVWVQPPRDANWQRTLLVLLRHILLP